MNPTLWYEEGYKYKTVRDYIIQTEIRPPLPIITDYIRLFETGEMWFRCGYAWDGPSGPTVDTPDSMVGSLVHDGGYQLMRARLLDPAIWRKPFDRELWRLCIADGMLKPRADLWYVAVRGFAEGAATVANEILSAPVPGVPMPAD